MYAIFSGVSQFKVMRNLSDLVAVRKFSLMSEKMAFPTVINETIPDFPAMQILREQSCSHPALTPLSPQN